MKSFALGALALSLAGTMLVLSACSPRKHDGDNRDHATFWLDKVTAVSVQQENPIPGWGLAQAVKYSLYTCAHDRRTREPVRGHRFDVYTADGEFLATKNADINGCFSWDDTLPINPVADAKAVEIVREIRAMGFNLGTRKVKLAVYPWLCAGCNPGTRVVDLNYDSVPAAQLAPEARATLMGLSEGVPASRPLAITDALFQGTTDVGAASGGSLKMRVAFTPKISVNNLLGLEDPVPLLRGRFNVTIDAYANLPDPTPGSQGTRRVQIAHGTTLEPVAINNNIVEADLAMYFSAFVQNGTTELVLSVQPVGAPANIQGLVSLYGLPSGASLVGIMRPPRVSTSSGRGAALFATSSFDSVPVDPLLCTSLRNSSHPVLAGYAKCAAVGGLSVGSGSAQGTVTSGLLPAEAYNVRDLSARPWGVINGNSLVRRDVLYNVQICLNVPAESFRNASNVNFEVEDLATNQRVSCYEPGNDTTVQGASVANAITSVRPVACRTNPQGCINIQDRISHSFYKPEVRSHRQFRLRSGRYSTVVGYTVNPWEENTPGEWTRNLPGQRLTETTPLNPGDSHFEFARFGWKMTSDGFTYGVNKYLDMTLKKHVTLTLDGGVVRNNTISRWLRDSEGMRPGWYAVKVALQQEYYNYDATETNIDRATNKVGKFISVSRRLVWFPGGGQFKSDLTLVIPDLRIVRIRANLLVEVALADESLMETGLRNSRRSPPEDLREEEFNRFVVHGAGLEPATFVGSTIMLLEQDGGPLRSTSMLSSYVCQRVGCSSDGAPVAAPNTLLSSGGAGPGQSDDLGYVGQLSRLQDKTVTDLERESVGLRHAQEELNVMASRFSNSLQVANLDYLTTARLSEEIERDPQLANHNTVFVGPDPMQVFLDELNVLDTTVTSQYPGARAYTRADLVGLMREGRLSRESSARLCRAFVRRAYRAMIGERAAQHLENGPSGISSARGTLPIINFWIPECDRMAMNDLRRTPETIPMWNLERKTRTLRVDPVALDKRQGFLLNFSAGADFGVGHNVGEDDSMSVGASAGFGMVDFIRKVATTMSGAAVGLTAGAALAGGTAIAAGTALMTPLAIAGAALGIAISGSISMDWSRSNTYSESHGEKLGFNSSTYLGADILPLDINVREHQKCVAIRLSFPHAARVFHPMRVYMAGQIRRENTGRALPASEIERMVENRFVKTAFRGVMICDGEVTTTPMPIVERYYYLSQQMADGLQNDPRKLQNNPWLLGLRGRRNFLSFVGELRARSYCMGMSNRHVNQAEAPIEQMAYPFRAQPQTLELAANAYRIQGVVPTIKGLHSTDDSARNQNLDLPIRNCHDNNPAPGRWGNRSDRMHDLWRAIY